LRSQAYRRGVLSSGPYANQRGVLLAGRDSTGVLAWRLVVPVYNPNVLVYPQPAAPVPTLVLSVERHTPRLVALDPLGIEKGSKYSITEVGTN
jgi:hypothetical protein